MSDENFTDGKHHFITGDEEVRAWFKRQWEIWPKRADRRYTTNASFHYGGVVAYRETNEGVDPIMSRDFASCVKWMDKHYYGSEGTSP